MRQILKVADRYRTVLAGGKQFRKQLDKKILSSLKIEGEKENYLLSLGYRQIGTGGSRNVFLVSSKKVIKIADDPFGISQNKLEFETLASGRSNFLPKVYDHAPDFRWIEVETVRQLSSLKELCRLLNITYGNNDYLYIFYDDYLYILRQLKNTNVSLKQIAEDKISFYRSICDDDDDDMAREECENIINRWKKYLYNPILNEMVYDINRLHIPTHDLDVVRNLGVNSNGHLVFLDTGYNEQDIVNA